MIKPNPSSEQSMESMEVIQMETQNPWELKNHPVNQKIYGDKVDKELVADVKKRGVIEPIHVVDSKEHGGLVIVSGHRRNQSARIADLRTVPVIIRKDLKTPEDIEEALILSNRITRERTNEQKAHEFRQLLLIEKIRAEERSKAGETPALNKRRGRAEDIAAEGGGLGRDTAKKANRVVEEIESLEKKGHIQKAEKLRQTLNENVSEAHRQVSKPKPKAQKPGATFDWKKFNKLLGPLIRHVDKAAKFQGCVNSAVHYRFLDAMEEGILAYKDIQKGNNENF